MKHTHFATFSPAKILVCQLRQIGDVVLATPAIELLRRRYPFAELHVLTEQKCTSILAHNPTINKIWGLDKKKIAPLYRELSWYWKLARVEFDLVVDFQQLPRCRWVVAFSGASVRLSYTPPWYTRPLYNHYVDALDGYAAMAKASILTPLGIHWHGERPRIYLTPDETTSARALLAGLGLRPEHRLISIDPTHRQPTRRWPLQHYAKLICNLAARDASLRFLPLWGPGEEKDIRELAKLCPAGALLLPVRMLTLREMAACIAEARLHVGNCSAPRHIAVAVGTPSCSILGSTSSSWTYPSPEHTDIAAHLPCQPCNRNFCDHLSCLINLSPEVVTEHVMGMLT
ncbi:MAG: glycosyltransferase family 9 protein [Bilophila sp.]